MTKQSTDAALTGVIQSILKLLSGLNCATANEIAQYIGANTRDTQQILTWLCDDEGGERLMMKNGFYWLAEKERQLGASNEAHV